jgi:hypothetical protein
MGVETMQVEEGSDNSPLNCERAIIFLSTGRGITFSDSLGGGVKVKLPSLRSSGFLSFAFAHASMAMLKTKNPARMGEAILLCGERGFDD